MKQFLLVCLLLALLPGCAVVGTASPAIRERAEVWGMAQAALASADFEVADSLFQSIVERYPGTVEGRESLFYLGSIKLDPRNPAWDSRPAAAHLAEYLDHMQEGGPPLNRYPEAQVLFELARQLNLPGESRVAGLQPEERVVMVPERVVVPAAENEELAAMVTRLREEIAAKDARIREQEEELERIRRTLTGTPRQ
jgi:hypothetical protein